MMNLPKLTTLALLAALGFIATDSFAATYSYRVLNKGVKPVPAGVGGGAGTGGGGAGSGTSEGTVYATSGVQYLYGGNVVTAHGLDANGTEYTMTLRNSSVHELRGWLVNPAGGQAVVDMTRSTCGQTATIPTVLAPGASCTFTLISRVAAWNNHPADVLQFMSLQNTPIPDYLAFPLMTTTTNEGGGLGSSGGEPIGDPGAEL